MSNKKYVMTAGHAKKLRNLAREEKQALDLMTTSFINGNVKEAKAASIIAQQARGRQEAFFNQLVGWYENGVPQSYAK